jgi:hypothetical protein
VFTARYALSPYIKQIHFVFKGLISPVYDKVIEISTKIKTEMSLTLRIHTQAYSAKRVLRIPNRTNGVSHHSVILNARGRKLNLTVSSAVS